MQIAVRRVEYASVQELREMWRQEAGCQIVRDSLLGRGLATPFVVRVDGRIAGYGAVRRRIDPGRLTEFYVVPEFRRHARELCGALLAESGATAVEAQTNMPSMVTMLYDFATRIRQEAVLFHDASATDLTCPGAAFRSLRPQEAATVFKHRSEPVGAWCIEVDGAIVATGGALDHYNPPYVDLHMEVAEPARGRGYGSFLVQALKRTCRERGKVPAARCNPGNLPSRRCLEKAGMLPCGRLLVGGVNRSADG